MVGTGIITVFLTAHCEYSARLEEKRNNLQRRQRKLRGAAAVLGQCATKKIDGGHHTGAALINGAK